MSDYIIRPWKNEDKEQLFELWHIGFGDSKAMIGEFYDLLAEKDFCLVAEADGKVVSAMYILRHMDMNPYRRNILNAGYAYALATLPEYRGQGIGTAVYKAVTAAILDSADIALVLPADEGLYPFYEQASGAFPVSFVREARLTREQMQAGPEGRGMRSTIPMYNSAREGLMGEMPHAALSVDHLFYLESAGCDFFIMKNSAAICETRDDICYVWELLDPSPDCAESLATIASWCPAKEYVVRTPLFFKGPGEKRPYMLGSMKQLPDYPLPQDMWFGPGME